MPLHFSSKDFEILDLDPPNNPTSHYGACHFGYNLALMSKHDDKFSIISATEIFAINIFMTTYWEKKEKELK